MLLRNSILCLVIDIKSDTKILELPVSMGFIGDPPHLLQYETILRMHVCM